MYPSLLLSLVLSAALASEHPSVDPKDVMITDEMLLVENCTSAGEVKARSYGVLAGPAWAEIGIDRIREDLRKRAAALGARVVLVKRTSSKFVASATGTAYRCSLETLQRARDQVRRRDTWSQEHGLPERAFDTDSGFIGMQAGVMLRPGTSNALGKATAYILRVRNGSDLPALVVASLALQQPPIEAVSWMQPHEMVMLRWDSNGVPADREIPLVVSVFTDLSRTMLLGSQKTSMYFIADELKLLLEGSPRLRANQALLMSGWKEMLNKPLNVEGTRASEELQHEIAWTLYREESKTHRDCTHSVVAATSQELDAAALAARFPDARAETLQSAAKPNGVVETWKIKSCDAVTEYDVLLPSSDYSWTDILTQRAKQ